MFFFSILCSYEFPRFHPGCSPCPCPFFSGNSNGSIVFLWFSHVFSYDFARFHVFLTHCHLWISRRPRVARCPTIISSSCCMRRMHVLPLGVPGRWWRCCCGLQVWFFKGQGLYGIILGRMENHYLYISMHLWVSIICGYPNSWMCFFFFFPGQSAQVQSKMDENWR